jgi:hypothetical protein
MKTVLAAALAMTLGTMTSFAQQAPASAPAPSAPAPQNCCEKAAADAAAEAPAQEAQQPQVAAYTPPVDTSSQASEPATPSDDEGWKRPVGRRFMHGFRLGWMYLFKMNDSMYKTRTDDMGTPITIGEKFGLRSPNMMLIGYEGFYRIVGHSWLNVLMIGNVTVAGLEQSKFIPAASGLLGFEFDRSFQIGVGVNLTPDPDAPSHMIAAAGWTPSVGSIQTPVHFFFVPDPDGNHRTGATVGMTW